MMQCPVPLSSTVSQPHAHGLSESGLAMQSPTLNPNALAEHPEDQTTHRERVPRVGSLLSTVVAQAFPCQSWTEAWHP